MLVIIIGKIANFESGRQQEKGVQVFLRSRGKKKYPTVVNPGK